MVSTKQAAKLANVTPSTIRYAILRGDLPAQKLGRDWLISEQDLRIWIDNPDKHRPGRRVAKS